MAESDLDSLQVKFTYVGTPQRRLLPALLFTSSTNTIDVSRFVPFYRQGVNYNSDGTVGQAFNATTQQLKALIDSVGTLPAATAGDVDPGGTASFAMLNVVNGVTVAYEKILNPENGRAAFGKILSVFRDSATATSELSATACVLGMMPGPPPQDVSASVAYTLTGVRFDRKMGTFVGKIKATNTSGTPIPGPLSVALEFRGGVALVSRDGITSCPSPVADLQYVNFVMSGDLQPSQNVEKKLVLSNPDLERVEIANASFIAGPGPR